MAKNTVRTGQAGNYAAPVDVEGMDPAMKATLGLGPKGRETRPTSTQDVATPAPARKVLLPAGNGPGSAGWARMEAQIQEAKAKNRQLRDQAAGRRLVDSMLQK